MKILLLDIETKPAQVFTWSLFKPMIGINQVIEPGGTISWAAKWLGDKETSFKSVYHDGKTKMIRAMHKLLDEADVVVHFNGESFDVPHLNSEFIQLGLTPPSPYKQIDLMKVWKKKFYSISNKLQFVSLILKIGQKVKTDFDLWLDCMANKPAAWKLMKTYNIQDVTLLEKFYNKILPWIPNHPNWGLHTGQDSCPSCGSKHYQSRGVYRLVAGVYPRFSCSDCGSWFRGSRPIKSLKSKMRSIGVS